MLVNDWASNVSTLQQYVTMVGVAVGVRVKVAVGGGFGLRMQMSSICTVKLPVCPFDWNCRPITCCSAVARDVGVALV